MVDNKKSLKQFIEVESKKTPEQIEEEILADPAYPKLTPTPKMHDDLMNRIAVYEAEKAKTEEEQRKEIQEGLGQLTEDDKKALRLGRELMAKAKAAEERDGKTEETSEGKSADGQNSSSNMVCFKKGKKKKKKVYLLVAAAAICVCGIGITAMGGPDTVIKSMTGTLGGREQSRVDIENKKNTVISGESKEEVAYQKIKDELNFDPVRLVYLPNNFQFQEMRMNKEIQNVSVIYSCENLNLVYTIQANYVDNKLGLDIEDRKTDEYYQNVDEKKVLVKEYEIEDKHQKEYSAEFIWKNTKYYLTGILDKYEFEEIIKNLHFV